MLLSVFRLASKKRNTFRYFSCSARKEKKFDVLFLGRDEFSCRVFNSLYGADDLFSRLEVVTNPDERVGRRGSQLSVSPLKTLAESLDIPVHLIPRAKRDFRKWELPTHFTTADASDRLLVTASFGRILPSTMLDHFEPLHRLNVHPSLVPKYRGPAPIQHAILNGDSETGVSILSMLKRSEGIDSGRVLASRRVALPTNATYPQALEDLAIQGGKLLVSVLRDMQAGIVNAVEQEGDVTHAPFITLEDSVVDFKTMSAASIERRHRAISHQRPLTARTSNGSTVQLHSITTLQDIPAFLPQESGVAVYSKPQKSILIRCADGSAVSIEQLKADGKALVAGREWWNGVDKEDGKYYFV